eukprot:CAMPEP_0115866968 /NCGR_PEP_ID=MMETSP0287-20121206/20526_1 /TAXON_ID=412157 /ORGANISM="Chrysochromulina rotalis, Strain UIO044" /LENGTH=85 /DNA_ID=CAMNT_0003321559 /DNA_START=69 /DNA_END=326 /DNA_ORIENTATION=+
MPTGCMEDVFMALSAVRFGAVAPRLRPGPFTTVLAAFCVPVVCGTVGRGLDAVDRRGALRGSCVLSAGGPRPPSYLCDDRVRPHL